MVGDGGFLMTGQEVETAVRYGAAITVVVFRNGMHGTIAMHQKRALGRTAGIEIGEVNLAGYARSLGAEGHTVRDPDGLAPAMEAALASDTVTLLDVVSHHGPPSDQGHPRTSADGVRSCRCPSTRAGTHADTHRRSPVRAPDLTRASGGGAQPIT